MVQQIIEWLGELGKPGLYIVMLLEGSSLPFPGVILVLSFGYILSPGYLDTAFLAINMSICYSLASLIPYFLAKKLESFISKRLKKGLDKGRAFFNRFGVWSIALSRPLGVGNYISYIAGMSRVNVFKYFSLTLIGIYPWSYVMIMLGDYFNGSYEAFKQFFDAYSIYVYIAAGLVILGVIVFIYYTKLKKDISPRN
ncbi:DedA family protein [Virgibacillus oceani]|uniref:Alkaline phosphatase n=1 Tax=Virgibacillus oceani TaxID=1479511 RepID=A0A917HMM6_9BACI|nr:VTT domain-containing protein [Virgibacillus oceani]GGG83355.1 alkaline phosphatase [Virgibacillus oceani]